MAKTTKQQVIENLTELVTKVQEAYFSGKFRRYSPRVHRSFAGSKRISIDLYHFEGDGLPVCDGLNPCTLELECGVTVVGDEIFCMVFDPEWEDSKLKFIVSPNEEACDYDVDPEVLTQETLENITVWLKGQMNLGGEIKD